MYFGNSWQLKLITFEVRTISVFSVTEPLHLLRKCGQRPIHGEDFLSQNPKVHVAGYHLKSVIIRIQIFGPTFCVSLYTPQVTTYHIVFFLSL